MTKWKMALVALITLFFIAGCAGNKEKPVEQFAKSEAMISQARSQGARQYSAAALNTAEEKLREARRASENGDHQRAERLAHEAEVDAQYAIASADTAKVQKVAETLRSNLNTLRRQVQ